MAHLKKMMKICVPIKAKNLKACQKKMEKSEGADMFEIWIDHFESMNKKNPCYENLTEILEQLIKKKKKPLIFVNKAKIENGRWRRTEIERVRLLEDALNFGADYIDIGLHTDEKLIRNLVTLKYAINAKNRSVTRGGKKPQAYSQAQTQTQAQTYSQPQVYSQTHGKKHCDLIISYHDFKTQVGLNELKNISEKAMKLGADIVKIATTPTSIEAVNDLLQLARRLKSRKQKYIVLGMGKLGKLTRVFAEEFGSFLTYGAISRDETTAPGQLEAKELKTIWKILRN